MRALLAVALALALAGCRHKKPADAEPAPSPDRNPYRNVMPAKVKKDVEEIDRRHEEKMDTLQKSAQ